MGLWSGARAACPDGTIWAIREGLSGGPSRPPEGQKNEQGQSPAQISSLSMNPGVAAFFRARQRVTAPMDCPPKTWTAEVHLLMVPRDGGTLAHQISFVTYRTQLAGKYSSCGAILYRTRTLAL